MWNNTSIQTEGLHVLPCTAAQYNICFNYTHGKFTFNRCLMYPPAYTCSQAQYLKCNTWWSDHIFKLHKGGKMLKHRLSCNRFFFSLLQAWLAESGHKRELDGLVPQGSPKWLHKNIAVQRWNCYQFELSC